jgi:integrase
MEQAGLKTNTRRRKILSAKALVRYAVSRKKLVPSAVRFVKAPERLERLPWIPLPRDWEKIRGSFRLETPLGLRNALLAELLAETGLTVAELCALRWEQVKGRKLEVEGKRPRRLQISEQAAARLGAWRAHSQGKFLFPGFNRHGVTSERMTSRGVELIFRRLAKSTGFRQLKPKTLRHFAIASWLRENQAEAEIQRRLGVHPHFSLDAYRKHLQSQS